MLDKPTLDKINTLHPFIREEVKMLVSTINNKILTGKAKIRVVQATRTFKEQQDLYNQGRTSPGKIVTQAKAGDSIHNYGLAFDMCLIIDNKEVSWDTVKDFDNDRQSDWMEIVTFLKKFNYVWGGDWRSFKDMPHFEKTGGNTLNQLKIKYKNKDFIKNTNFVTI